MARDRSKEYARNKAKRRLAGLQKSLQSEKWDEVSRKNIEARISEFKQVIADSYTYADGKRIAGRTKGFIENAMKRMKTLNNITGIRREVEKKQEFSGLSTGTRNELFKNQLNTASMGESFSVTIAGKSFQMTDSMVRMFYRTYQRLWNTGGADRSKWNELILEKTGFRTLEAAFAFAMGIGDNYKKANILDKKMHGIALTDEEAITLYGMLGERASKYGAGDVALNTEQVDYDPYEEVFNYTDDEIIEAIRAFTGNEKLKLSDID